MPKFISLSSDNGGFSFRLYSTGTNDIHRIADDRLFLSYFYIITTLIFIIYTASSFFRAT